MGGNEHVSGRFRRMLALYRKPDGGEWGGQDLENATGGAVTRSYVPNLKNGRTQNPGLSKLEAIAAAMGFPPALWFGTGERAGHVPDEAVGAALRDETLAALLEEAMKLGKRDRRLLLRMARQVSPSPESPTKATNEEGGEA